MPSPSAPREPAPRGARLPEDVPRRFIAAGLGSFALYLVVAGWGRAHPPPRVVAPVPLAVPERPVASLAVPEPSTPVVEVATAPTFAPIAEDPDATQVVDALEAAHGRLASAGRDPGRVMETVFGVRRSISALDRPIGQLRATREPSRLALANAADSARTQLLRATAALQAAARVVLDGTGEKGLADPFAEAERTVASAEASVRAASTSR